MFKNILTNKDVYDLHVKIQNYWKLSLADPKTDHEQRAKQEEEKRKRDERAQAEAEDNDWTLTSVGLDGRCALHAAAYIIWPEGGIDNGDKYVRALCTDS